jgi:hypothetical protein
LRLVECCGIGDALTALLRRERIHQEMSRAHEPRLDSRRSLDGHQLVHQVCINALPELGQGFGQYEMGLGMIRVDRRQATGIHDCHIGAQALTDVFIGRAQFMFEEFQGQQHPGRDRRAAPQGMLGGKTLGKTAPHRLNHGLPRKGIGPQTNGMGVRDKLGSLEVRTASAEPVL